MFGIGFSELLVIGLILVIAVGPNRMPGMLKAVVKAYREFRRATRDLRASTGIDEILQDEDLRELRKPLMVPPATKPAAKPVPRKRSLTVAERAQESPPEGVDIAEVREAERRPSPEEASRIRAEKLAAAARDEEIVAAKIAAAQREDDDPDGIRAAKIAAAQRELEDDDPDGIRAAKIAAAEE
jgi:sec-independent protein translocase protein TatB